jgi:mannose-6-phosphate isomerase-like protein (cupin superfamily)
MDETVIYSNHLLEQKLYQESGDYIVMLVAGPNARKDYHYNETEELFYQEGSIKIVIQEEGVRKEMELHAGDMYLHPANVPHSSAFSGFNRFSNRTQTSWGRIYGRTFMALRQLQPQTVRSKI